MGLAQRDFAVNLCLLLHCTFRSSAKKHTGYHHHTPDKEVCSVESVWVHTAGHIHVPRCTLLRAGVLLPQPPPPPHTMQGRSGEARVPQGGSSLAEHVPVCGPRLGKEKELRLLFMLHKPCEGKTAPLFLLL